MSTNIFSTLGPNSGLIRELYELYLDDPSLVDKSWADYFAALNGVAVAYTNGNHQAQTASALPSTNLAVQEKAVLLVQAYRNWGHFRAAYNPLSKGVEPRPELSSLKLENFEISSAEMEATVRVSNFAGRSEMKLAELVSALKQVYCGSIGFEYNHINNDAARNWLEATIEERYGAAASLPDARKIRILKNIIESEVLEQELTKRYPGQTRFSLEGSDTLIAILDTILADCAVQGVREVIMGMAHRGRVNVLVNTLGKPLNKLLAEFEDLTIHAKLGSGDVKYHLDYSTKYKGPNGETVEAYLAPNPSHLEFVSPVIEGIVRAKQDLNYARDRKVVLPLLMHGEAAFVGQGIVSETFQLSQVEGYKTGGTIHLVTNNQVGFTTSPYEARSSAYCSDFAKAVNAPVFHINAEDPIACAWAASLALQFRQRFGIDFVLDIYGYRKLGHNEGDDPTYTQPAMYQEIKAKRTIGQIFSEQLIGAGVVEKRLVDEFMGEVRDRFEIADKLKNRAGSGEACGLVGKLRVTTPKTAVSLEDLRRVAASMITYPEGFVPHPKLKGILEKRVSTLESGGIDWGFAEGLAFGSLVLEGHAVRLSGQDCCRGTFGQRHLGLTHYETHEIVRPLNQLAQPNSDVFFEVYNSILSESAVMGFEFGYSTVANRALVLWEGQFGDFSNGAQVIIDQFLASSEAKWNQFSGLTLLLPHGYEGRGPEHSSARLERYLQLCAEGNMTVCYPSNSAQHFHLMRRQGLTVLQRPLIVMTPKSLLRLPEAACTAKDLSTGEFKPIIETDYTKDGKAKYVVFLSGKVFYDVAGALSKLNGCPVKVIRMEQLYPLPEKEIKAALKALTPKKYIWVQEEPENMGAWNFADYRFRTELGIELEYIGRPLSASTATGSGKRSAAEVVEFLDVLVKRVQG